MEIKDHVNRRTRTQQTIVLLSWMQKHELTARWDLGEFGHSVRVPCLVSAEQKFEDMPSHILLHWIARERLPLFLVHLLQKINFRILAMKNCSVTSYQFFSKFMEIDFFLEDSSEEQYHGSLKPSLRYRKRRGVSLAESPANSLDVNRCNTGDELCRNSYCKI